MSLNKIHSFNPSSSYVQHNLWQQIQVYTDVTMYHSASRSLCYEVSYFLHLQGQTIWECLRRTTSMLHRYDMPIVSGQRGRAANRGGNASVRSVHSGP